MTELIDLAGLDELIRTINPGEMPAWYEDALCAQTDPEAFYPEKGGSASDAKRICRRCTVQIDCRLDAVRRGEQFGVWGGLSTSERHKLRKAA